VRSRRGEGCLGGSTLLDALSEGLGRRACVGEAEQESLNEALAIARAQYDEMVRHAIRRGMISDFETAAGVIAREALRELKSWSGGERKSDFPKLRKLESLGVPRYLRDEVRRELLAMLEVAGATEDGLHRVDARLEEAVERVLLPPWRHATRVIVSEDSGTIGPIKTRLIEEGGFTEVCADELIARARTLVDQPGRMHLALPARARRDFQRRPPADDLTAGGSRQRGRTAAAASGCTRVSRRWPHPTRGSLCHARIGSARNSGRRSGLCRFGCGGRRNHHARRRDLDAGAGASRPFGSRRTRCLIDLSWSLTRHSRARLIRSFTAAVRVATRLLEGVRLSVCQGSRSPKWILNASSAELQLWAVLQLFWALVIER
jgi:hypothetical protein